MAEEGEKVENGKDKNEEQRAQGIEKITGLREEEESENCSKGLRG